MDINLTAPLFFNGAPHALKQIVFAISMKIGHVHRTLNIEAHSRLAVAAGPSCHNSGFAVVAEGVSNYGRQKVSAEWS